MRLVGALLLLIGIGAAGWGVHGAFTRAGAKAWLAAVAAPIALLAAFVGALLIFVPTFFR